jgi:hypothetical protein
MKKSTKGHNSVNFGCSKNSFLFCHLHIKVVHPWKLKQNLPSGLRGVAFTRFRDGLMDGRTDGQVQRYMLPHCGGITRESEGNHTHFNWFEVLRTIQVILWYYYLHMFFLKLHLLKYCFKFQLKSTLFLLFPW